MGLTTYPTLCHFAEQFALRDFASASTPDELEQARVKWLGRNGIVRELGRLL